MSLRPKMLSRHGLRLSISISALLICCFILISAAAQASISFQNEDISATIKVNNFNLGSATTAINAVPIDLSDPITFSFTFDVLTTNNIVIERVELTVYFADVPVYTHREPLVPPLAVPGSGDGIISGSIDLQSYLAPLGVQLVSGVYRVSANLIYHYEGVTTEKAIGTDYPTVIPIYFRIAGNPILSVVGMSAAGGAVLAGASTIATVASIAGVGGAVGQVGALTNLGTGGMTNWYELVMTGKRLHSIRRNARDVLALPNLAVLAGTPLLASAVVKLSDKEAASSPAEQKQILDGVRERALAAWAGVQCPNCSAKWTELETPCKKCKLEWEQGQKMFADKLTDLADKALPILSKKKEMTVANLRKKLKTDKYSAGLLGTILTDIGATEIVKIKTPTKRLLFSGGTIAVSFLFWGQLLGYFAMGIIGWIALISISLTTALFFALIIARMAQGKRIRAKQQQELEKPKPTPTPKDEEETLPSEIEETTPPSEEPSEEPESVDEEPSEEPEDVDEEPSEEPEDVDEDFV